MLSVNTNGGAMIALQYLNQTQAQIAQTQSAISTGQKVSSAKDDGATYAIAQNMRGNVAAYSAVSDSLNRAMSATDVAISAASSISDLLVQMKQKALSAADVSIDSASRAALNNDFTAMRDQIQTIVDNAAFNGFNLLDGKTPQIKALVSTDGNSTIDVSAQTMSLGKGVLANILSSDNISTQASAKTMVDHVQTSLVAVNGALAKLSAGAKQYSIQLNFTSKLSDTLTSGIGHLVDADMAVESAKLTALQTKQQLGVQALSIANSAPQSILQLFQ
jgi:Flagellin and related hook-associated proteins